MAVGRKARRYADYWNRREVQSRPDDRKPPAGPQPTRAWIRRASDDEAGTGFHCLVEEHPGDHWVRTGGFLQMLRWALVEREAQEFFIWNEGRRDWDRPSRQDVNRMIENR